MNSDYQDFKKCLKNINRLEKTILSHLSPLPKTKPNLNPGEDIPPEPTDKRSPKLLLLINASVNFFFIILLSMALAGLFRGL
jgi:hypothetical protein